VTCVDATVVTASGTLTLPNLHFTDKLLLSANAALTVTAAFAGTGAQVLGADSTATLIGTLNGPASGTVFVNATAGALVLASGIMTGAVAPTTLNVQNGAELRATVTSGALTLESGSSVNGATINVASVTVSGPTSFSGASSLSISGSLAAAGQTVTVAGSIVFNSITANGFSLSGVGSVEGVLTATAPVTFSATVAAGKSLRLAAGSMLATGATIAGTLQVDGTLTGAPTGSGRIEFTANSQMGISGSFAGVVGMDRTALSLSYVAPL
jgi:hypothetical protein